MSNELTWKELRKYIKNIPDDEINNPVTIEIVSSNQKTVLQATEFLTPDSKFNYHSIECLIN